MAKKVKESVNIGVGPALPGILRALEFVLLALAGYFILLYLRPEPHAIPVWAWIYGAWAVLSLPLVLRWMLVGSEAGEYRSWGRLAVWLFRDPRPDAGARRRLLVIAFLGLLLLPLAGVVIHLLSGPFSIRIIIALLFIVGLILVDRLVVEPLGRRYCRGG